MPFIGNTPDVNFTSFAKQDLTGVTGSPAKRGFTLTHAVANANEIEVFVNNVRQEPTDAYTVNGTGLTMTGDVETSDDFYIIYLGKALQTTVPPDGSVSTAKIANSAVDLTSKVTGVLPVANGGTGATSFVNTYTQLGTTTATTSGESVTITGIPTTAKQIIIHFMGVSHNGSGGDRTYTMLLGTASGIATSGYFSTVSATGAGNAQGTSTGQFAIYYNASGSDTLYGNVTLNLANSATHTYTQTGAIRSGTYVGLSAGMCNLGGALTQVKVLVSGRALDAGSISVTYI